MAPDIGHSQSQCPGHGTRDKGHSILISAQVTCHIRPHKTQNTDHRPTTTYHYSVLRLNGLPGKLRVITILCVTARLPGTSTDYRCANLRRTFLCRTSNAGRSSTSYCLLHPACERPSLLTAHISHLPSTIYHPSSYLYLGSPASCSCFLLAD